MDIRDDKFGITLYEKFESTSGKYLAGCGEHFNGIDVCYDIKCLNRVTREIITRHYSLKWEMLEHYEEWKEKMRGSGEYEQDEPEDFPV